MVFVLSKYLCLYNLVLKKESSIFKIYHRRLLVRTLTLRQKSQRVKEGKCSVLFQKRYNTTTI